MIRFRCDSREASLTYRIRRSEGPDGIRLGLSGEMDAEHAEQLEDLIAEIPSGSILLDLGEVTLVALEAVRFLARAEARGIRIAHCPDYVRSWIVAERSATAEKSR
jgi:hypothetical protein